jgi:hypothetical protein
MIVGRFVQSFRSGMGIKDAILAVWLGTNTSKKVVDQVNLTAAVTQTTITKDGGPFNSPLEKQTKE